MDPKVTSLLRKCILGMLHSSVGGTHCLCIGKYWVAPKSKVCVGKYCQVLASIARCWQVLPGVSIARCWQVLPGVGIVDRA